MTSSERSDDERAPFRTSSLKNNRERFLALVVEHSLECNRRSPKDFLRSFPPQTMMEGLAQQSRLRAKLLVPTTGVKQRVAERKSWQSAAEDLQIALEVGETNEAAVVALFDPDDRVRHLSDKALWAFVTEGEFWKTAPGKGPSYDKAKNHIAFILEHALDQQLLTHRELIEGLSVAEISSRLPKAMLGDIITRALENGKKGEAFTEVNLLATLPPSELVEYMPLRSVWENVIEPQIALRHEYAEHAAPRSNPAAAASPPAQASADIGAAKVAATSDTTPDPFEDDDEPTRRIELDSGIQQAVTEARARRGKRSSRPAQSSRRS